NALTSAKGKTTTTCSICRLCSNRRSVWMMTGMPWISRNCLGRLPPKRMPCPPATTIATFIRLRFGVVDARHRRSRLDFAQRSARALGAVTVFRLVVNFSENHFAGRRLQHTGHRNVSVLSNQPPRVVHHDHRAVVEISHALVVFLAFLED